jgi:hypothetical protein
MLRAAKGGVSKHEASPFETAPQRLLRVRRKDEI